MSTRTEIIERLRELQQADGRLDPKKVVEDARDITSPLHDSFEWDNSVAAEQHRLQQARRLIGAVKFDTIVRHVPLQAPVYVRDPGDSVYRTLVSVRSEEDTARAAVIEAMQRAKAQIKRASTLARVLGLEEELANLNALVEMFTTRVRSADDRPEGTA